MTRVNLITRHRVRRATHAETLADMPRRAAAFDDGMARLAARWTATWVHREAAPRMTGQLALPFDRRTP